MTTSWYLADLGEARGKQELFTRQSPQKLKVLREHAVIESAVSSNRIEGVTVNQKRIGTIVFGKKPLKDRNEEEVRFKTVEASKTPAAVKKLIEAWQDVLKEKSVHPLIALAAFNLDFLCVHPFRDGNGRVSRLLLLLQC